MFFGRGQEVLADPYPYYARLRSEDPIHRRVGTREFFIITKYDYVLQVLKSPSFSSDRNYGGHTNEILSHLPDTERSSGAALQRFAEQMLLGTDPPKHTRLRRVMHRALISQPVETLRASIQRCANALLDDIFPAGGLDVVTEFASPLAASVILEVIGIPQDDSRIVQSWTDDLIFYFDGTREVRRAYPSLLAFQDYVIRILDQRRRRPTSDLLSTLAIADEDGNRLSDDEIAANILNLILAGNQTMIALIGNGMLTLLRHPESLHQIRTTSGLIESALEELLRYDSPDQATLRIAMEDCSIGDKKIAAGMPVSLWLGAANRDPERFQMPDCVDLTRTDNRHLAFAHGIHFCLGATLARLEGQIAIETILQRLPDIRLAHNHLEWQEDLTLRALKSLPVTFNQGIETKNS